MPCYYVKSFNQNFYMLKRRPNVAGNAQFEFEEDWYAASHMHRNAELLFIVEGQCDVIIAGHNMLARKGDIIIVNPYVRHNEYYRKTVSEETPLKFYCCELFDFETDTLPLNHLLPDEYCPVQRTGQYEEHFHNLFEMLYEHHLSGGLWYAHICNNISNEIVLLVLRMMHERYGILEGTDHEIDAKRIKDYIDVHFCENIGANLISEALHMSRYTLLRAFLKKHEISPIQYLHKKRIDAAKGFIAINDYTLQTIAQKVGYNNYASFSSMFKRIVGQAPSEYRMYIKST